jgi:ferritin-like metal-binding protein YciE
MEKDLKYLLIDELHDILSSEDQIVEALPEMVKASNSPDLKKAFESHLKETKGQIQRLEKIFKLLKVAKKEKLCKATKGLIQECKEVLKDFKTKSPLRDAALISKAQRIEHYEISAYGTVRTFAKELDLNEVADLLQDTLNEEENADKKLTKIAEGGFFKSGINQQATEPEKRKAIDLNKPIKHLPQTSKPKNTNKPIKHLPQKSKAKDTNNQIKNIKKINGKTTKSKVPVTSK